MKGLLDIQVNGFAGVDFQSANLSASELRKAVDGLAAHGVSRFFAALITDSIDSLEAKFAQLEKLRALDPVSSERLCGYHLEGPWLSAELGYRGAHEPSHMGAPNLADFARLQKAAGGNIRLVTLAPELPGSEAFIRELVATGVEVSLGHTNASDEAIDRAINAGARFCTHLGNGVPNELHRHDNVIQRLLARDELIAFFIPDGIHLPPSVLKNLVRSKPSGRALFTTDCMAAAGAAPGSYSLGNLTLEVGEDRVVRMPGARNFAGSALCPDEGVRNLMDWLGWPEARAVESFSTGVAEAFGIELPGGN